MAVLKSLTNASLDALYIRCKTIINNLARKDKEKKRLHEVHRYILKVINIISLWNFPRLVEQYQNDDIKWKIRIQDVDSEDFSTLTLCLQSEAEFARFKAFLRHLIFNWFHGIEVEKLHNGYLSFIITQPVPVRLNIFPYDNTRQKDSVHSGSKKSSSVEAASKIISSLVEDFCLYTVDIPTDLSGSAELASKDKKLKKRKSLDEDFSYRENEAFNTSSYYFDHTSLDLLLQQLDGAYASLSASIGSSRSQFGKQLRKGGVQAQRFEVQHLKAENASLKQSAVALGHEVEVTQQKISELEEEKEEMATILAKRMEELQEAFVEIGRLSVEMTIIGNEKKKNERFNKTYNSHSASTQTPGVSGLSTAPFISRISHDQSTSSGIEHRHGQESVGERVNFSDMPQTGVYGNIYNNYKLLMLLISRGLLQNEVMQLQQWVETEFGVNSSGNVDAILLELDRKQIISITDLSRLRKYFEDNGRYDFVYLIDNFLLGDYTQLRNPKLTGRLRAYNQPSSAHNGSRFSSLSSSQSIATGRLTGVSQGPGDRSQRGALTDFLGLSRLRETQTGGSVGTSGSPQNAQKNGASLDIRRSHPGTIQRPTTSSSCSEEVTRNTPTSYGVQAVTDSARTNEVQTSGATVRGYQGNTSRNTEQGRNGAGGQSQGPRSSGNSRNGDSGLDDDDSQWLCSHYKRRCLVQFPCCDKFWPCHRCHNNQSACGRRKLKSRDTKQIKCVACGHEQPFAHYCSRCNVKFAQYFCGLCKHLTGNDDNPYHCEKCGICRIHGDRSFHCDVCGVCLDVQLRGNHKCREGSAHDECCICLEDAFTGCQILPCSHKVHKECATQMIRSGITRCPICRESFAHKLEKKSQKKPLGK